MDVHLRIGSSAVSCHTQAVVPRDDVDCNLVLGQVQQPLSLPQLIRSECGLSHTGG
jgi:hypothetical protein